MSIIYDEKYKTITLHTRNTTYQMQIDRYGFLLHLYYGKTAEGCMDYLLTYYDRGFSGNPYEAETDRTYSMDALPQEAQEETMKEIILQAQEEMPRELGRYILEKVLSYSNYRAMDDMTVLVAGMWKK